MLKINKPSQPLIPPTDVKGIEEIATSVASAAIASDTTHAPLVNELVPAENLPSYVDDVLNFPSLAEFPEVGEEGKIYVANDTNNTYRWSGFEYVQVGGSEIDLTPYAKKTEVNAALAEKADITYVDAEVEELEGAIAEKASSEDLAALATEVAAKANAAAVDEALALKANASDVYTKAQVDDALGMKANAIDVYTKAQVDNALAAKANAADVEADLALLEEEIKIGNIITLGPATAGTLTEEQIAKLPNLKFIKWALNYTDSFYLALVFSSPSDLQFRYTQIDASSNVTAYLLSITLQTATYHFSTSSQTLYTKAQVDTKLGQKQNTLVSGTNIKTINGQSILGSDDLEISNVAEYHSSVTGEENVIYIDKQNQKAYRYDSVNSKYLPLICDFEIVFSNLTSGTLTTESSKLLASSPIAQGYKAYFASYRDLNTSPQRVGIAFIKYTSDATGGYLELLETGSNHWESGYYFPTITVKEYSMRINTSSHTTSLTLNGSSDFLRPYSNRDQNWDTTPTANSTKPVTSGGIKIALDAKANANSVYTKSEVDSAIAAAIGDVLDQSF